MMGLLGQMLAGGVAGAADSASRSIQIDEERQYRDMVEQSRRNHEVYLAELNRQWRDEDRTVGVDPKTGLELRAKDLKDGQEVTTPDQYKANRPLSSREKELWDVEIQGKQADTDYKKAMADKARSGQSSAFGKFYDDLIERGHTPEEAERIALESLGRRGGSGKGSAKDAEKYEDIKTESGEIIRTYPNGQTIPMLTDDQLREKAKEKATSWATEKGDGLFNTEPSKEEQQKFAEKEYRRMKAEHLEAHKRAREESGIGGGFTSSPTKEGPGGVDMGKLTQAVAMAESGGREFNSNGGLITSGKGAEGKMQVMPATAGDPGYGVKPAKFTGNQIEDAKERTRVGEQYLAALVKEYNGNVPVALVAYNDGPGDANTWIKNGADPAKLPPETRAYVAKVMASYSQGDEGPVDKKALASSFDLRKKSENTPEQATSEQPQESKPKQSLLSSIAEEAGYIHNAGKEAAKQTWKAANDARDFGESFGTADRWRKVFSGMSDGAVMAFKAMLKANNLTTEKIEGMAEQAGKSIDEVVAELMQGYSKSYKG